MIPILAKPEETLYEHTSRALEVLLSLKKLFVSLDSTPFFPSNLDIEEFWNEIALSLILHDIGKAPDDFQKMLSHEEHQWNKFRHEVLSAIIADCDEWLPKSKKERIILGILSHHKSLDFLLQKYLFSKSTSKTALANFLDKCSQLMAKKEQISNFFQEIISNWQKDFPLACNFLSTLNSYFQRMDSSCDPLDNPVVKYVLDYNYMPITVKIQKEGINQFSGLSREEKVLYTLAKGLITACDHLASAGYNTIPQLPSKEVFYCKYEKNSIQEQMSRIKGSAILVAPTGSGKTEAALLWCRNNANQSFGNRIFYILPNVASINAMYQRLKSDFEPSGKKDLVTVNHYRAVLFLYNYFLEELDIITKKDEEEAKSRAKEIKDLYKKIYSPLKVTTPFQPLKTFFAFKGFERGVLELIQSCIVVDEIHTYNPHIIGLIFVMLKEAKESYNAKILLMSATFPKFLVKMAQEKLGLPRENFVAPPEVELKKNSRHEIILLDGGMIEYIDKIIAAVTSGKRTLVVCNTVRQAQTIANALQTRLSELKSTVEISLLHGRFALRDRINREQELKTALLAVATQAVEVSLDIDFDVMFTEPAPIDALIQRFGRVNRRGRHSTSPVYITTHGGQWDHLIYNKQRIDKTINALVALAEELEGSNSFVLNELLVKQLVERVYEDGYTQEEMDIFNDVFERFQ